MENLYKRVITESKPVGFINHEIVSVQVVGYVAIVSIIETLSAGSELKKVVRNGVMKQASKKVLQV